MGEFNFQTQWKDFKSKIEASKVPLIRAQGYDTEGCVKQVVDDAMADLESYSGDPDADFFFYQISQLDAADALSYNWRKVDEYLLRAEQVSKEFNPLAEKYDFLDSCASIRSKKRAIEVIKRLDSATEKSGEVYSDCLISFTKENMENIQTDKSYKAFLGALERLQRTLLPPLYEMRLLKDRGDPVCLLPDGVHLEESGENELLPIEAQRVHKTIGRDEIESLLETFNQYQSEIEKDLEKGIVTPEGELYCFIHQICTGIEPNFNSQFFKPHKIPKNELGNVKEKVRNYVSQGKHKTANNLYRLLQLSQVDIGLVDREIKSREFRWIYHIVGNYVSQLLQSKEAIRKTSGFRKDVLDTFGIEWEDLEIPETPKGHSEYVKAYCEKNISGKGFSIEGFNVPLGDVVSEKIMESVENSRFNEARCYLALWQLISDPEAYVKAAIKHKRNLEEEMGGGEWLGRQSDEKILKSMSPKNSSTVNVYKKLNKVIFNGVC